MQPRPHRMLMVLPRSRLVRKAVDAGYRVWSVCDAERCDPAGHGDVARYSEEVLTVDLADEAALRALVVRAARKHRVGHVMYFGGGAGVRPVLEEAHRLGLAANPPQAHRLLHDRAALRGLLHGHGRLSVRFRQVEARAGLRAAVQESGGHPVVVGSLAQDVGDDYRPFLATGPGALDAWARRTPGPYLVEEFLSGSQYTVSTLSVDGMHRVVGITATTTGGPPHFLAVEHVHPARIGERQDAEIRSAVCALLDLAGFEYGPADTTVVLTGTGPRIVSSRPGFPRDGIHLLLRLAQGIDWEAAFFQALTLGDGLPHTHAVRTAGGAFFTLPPGRVTDVSGLDEIRALPHVRAVHFPFRPGERVLGMTDGATVPGFVVVDGAGTEETVERLAVVRRMLRAVAEPAP